MQLTHHKPQKRWTEKEKALLMWAWHRWPSEEIAVFLGRSTCSVRGYACETMRLGPSQLYSQPPGRPRKPGSKRERKPGGIEKYQFKYGTGTHYKKILPPEKWPRIEHFFQKLLMVDESAHEQGKKVDVGVFLTEYIGIYVGRRHGDQGSKNDTHYAKWRKVERRRAGFCINCGKDPINRERSAGLCTSCLDRQKSYYNKGARP